MLCASASGANLRVDFSHAHALDMRQWHVRSTCGSPVRVSRAPSTLWLCAPRAVQKTVSCTPCGPSVISYIYLSKRARCRALRLFFTPRHQWNTDKGSEKTFGHLLIP